MEADQLFDKVYNKHGRHNFIQNSEGGGCQTLENFKQVSELQKPPLLTETQKVQKANFTFRNATRFFSNQRRASQSQNGQKKIQNSQEDLNRIQKYNKLLINQPTKLECLEDNITKNILIYTSEFDKNFLKPKQVPDSVKKIDQQIRDYQKGIEREIKKRQIQERRVAQKMIEQEHLEQEVETEGKRQAYDYLTNPQFLNPSFPPQNNDIGQEQEPQLLPVEIKQVKLPSPRIFENPSSDMNIHKELQKLERLYDKGLDKAYLKREYAGFFAQIKKKNPKLYITAKTNQLKKTGEPKDSTEHNYRVYNHENTPCVPQVMIPSFPNRKDMMAQCILDYLKDNSSLLKAEKINDFPKSVQNIIERAGTVNQALKEKQEKTAQLKVIKSI